MLRRNAPTHRVFSLAAVVAVLLASMPAIAAQRIVLKYRAHERSVDVEDLKALSETGEVSRPLQVYLRQANRDPEDLRQALNRELTVSPVLLDRLLNNPLGDFALDQVSQTIYTPSQQAERQALRAALVLSASDDGKVTFLEVLQNYPTPEVHVDGDRLAEAYEQLSTVIDRVGPLLEQLGVLRR